MAMRYAKRTSWWYALAICVQSVTLWVTQPAWAGIESYDPRLDPNYTRAPSGNPSVDWRAVEAFNHEFQARSALIGSQPSTGGYYASPQPWRYAGADHPLMVSQAGYPGLGYWASPVGGPYPYWSYWYGSGLYRWRRPVAPHRHHRVSVHGWLYGRHGGVMGYRGW